MISQNALHEIAQIANVSSDQVINVIVSQDEVEPDVRARVLTAMKLSQSFQRHASTQKPENSICAIMPHQIIEDAYIGALLQGAAETAQRSGFELLIQIYNPDVQEDLPTILRNEGVSGAVVLAPLHHEDALALHHNHEIPCVYVDYQGDLPIEDALIIEADNYGGVMLVMQHLIDLEHRRIGFISGLMSYASAQQRFAAYRDALQEAGIPYDATLVVEGDWMHSAAYALTKNLLLLDEPPTAIVASNDLTAFGAMQAAKEAGLGIGEQISITGFDDIPLAKIASPSLTTVRQPTVEIGSAAVEMLFKRLQGEPLRETHLCIATELVIRESTGQAPLESYSLQPPTDN